MCDYSDVYIVLKGTIDLLVAAANENDKEEKDVAFKNNTPFRSCISKSSNILIDSSEDFDIIMLMYKLLEYSHNYSVTSGSLLNYYRDEVDKVDFNDNASDGKSFNYVTKITGETSERQLIWPQWPPQPPPNLDGSQTQRSPQPSLPRVTILNIEVIVPLKHLSNFWKCLDLGLWSRALFIVDKRQCIDRAS